MKPQSAKAKGRKHQQETARVLVEVLKIDHSDAVSRPTGSPGEDIILSRAAKIAISPFTGFECKAVERLNVWDAWDQAVANSNFPIIVITKNRREMLAVVSYPLLLELLRERNYLTESLHP